MDAPGTDARRVSRRRLLQGVAGLLVLAAALPSWRERRTATPPPDADDDLRTRTLKALVATVVPGDADEVGAAEVGIHESLRDVLETVEPDASMTAVMYLDEIAIDLGGRSATFAGLHARDRDRVLADMCTHADESVRVLGHFLVVGSLLLFYSEVGAELVASGKAAGLLPESCRGPWEQAGYRGSLPRPKIAEG